MRPFYGVALAAALLSTIGDLRHVEIVTMDGKLLDANKLRAAVGVSKRPLAELAE